MNGAPLWTSALRSRQYAQTTGELCAVYENGNSEYCCLGVACEVMGLTYVTSPREARGFENEDAVLPRSVAAWLYGIKDWEVTDAGTDPLIAIPQDYTDRSGVWYYLRCTTLNDDLHFTFDEIADLVDYFGIVQE